MHFFTLVDEISELKTTCLQHQSTIQDLTARLKSNLTETSKQSQVIKSLEQVST